MSDVRITELLKRKISGRISLSEQNELYKLLCSNEAIQKFGGLLEEFNRARPEFNKPGFESSYFRIRKNVLKRIAESEQEHKGKTKIRHLSFRKIAVAASIIALIGLNSLYLYNNSFKSNNERKIETVTLKGSKSNLTLPDGTKVWINADSKLSYDESFGKVTRDVTLKGEAFFDVVKDKNHPFIVHTTSMDVKVLGTAFNVRAYENETNAQTTLLRGKVEVFLRNQNNEKITLNPNEKILVKNTEPNHHTSINKKDKIDDVAFTKIELNPIDSSNYETGWMNNRLVFRQEKFEEIIYALERWYNVKFVVKRIPQKLLRGTFENDSLEDVLKAFQISADINYKIEKDTVIIY